MSNARARAIVRSEIEELLAEFAYLIDHDRSAEVVDLFTADGSYAIGDRISRGRAALIAAYAARADRGVRTSRHIWTNARIEWDGGDAASATSLMTLFAEDGPPPHPARVVLVAEYVDDLVRLQGGPWRFASRVATGIFVGEGIEPVLPLGKQGIDVKEDQ